ncbi:Sperm-associated antigen 16 protein [Fukomys damarensis]|uniref:Sperm-associated antigen 16 protein n=1 Tax=Fukomys damarensis TaxID=885580 RepID=A0A091CLP6_FUKDA|nr:Sperm-associated antigen 16 protein [Fukomys damarensis]
MQIPGEQPSGPDQQDGRQIPAQDLPELRGSVKVNNNSTSLNTGVDYEMYNRYLDDTDSSERCRGTLYGHTDSVNSIEFFPFSNTLLTGSADKTLSIWDARTGTCEQSLYGHMHAIHDAIFSPTGHMIASCDACGVIKLWDFRKLLPVVSIDVGPSPGNEVNFDSSGIWVRGQTH